MANPHADVQEAKCETVMNHEGEIPNSLHHIVEMLRKVQKENRQLNSTVRDLDHKLKESNLQWETAQKKLDQANRGLEEVSANLSQTQDAKDQLQQSCDSLSIKCDAYASEVDGLKDEVKNLMEESKNQLNRAEHRMKTQAEAAAKDMEELESKHSSMTQRAIEAELELVNLQADYKQEKAKAESLKKSYQLVQTKNEDLHKSLKEMIADRLVLEREVKRLTQLVDDGERKNNESNEKFKETQEFYERSQTEVKALREEVTYVSVQLQQAQQENIDSRNVLNETTAKYKENLDQLSRGKTVNEKLQAGLAAEREFREQLEEEKSRVTEGKLNALQEIEQLKVQLHAKNEEAESRKELILARAKDLQDIQQSNVSLKHQYEKYRENCGRQIKELENKISLLRSEVEELSRLLRSKTSAVEDLRGQAEKAETDLNRHKSSGAKCRQELQQVRAKLQETERTLATRNDELRKVQSKLKEKEAAIPRLAEQQRSSDLAKMNALTELQEKTEVLSELQKEVEAKKSEITAICDQLRNSKEQLEEAEANSKRLMKECDNLKNVRNHLTTQLTDVSAQLASEKKLRQRRELELNDKATLLARLKAEAEDMESSVASANEAALQKKNQVAKLNSDVEKLKADLATTHAELENMTRKVEETENLCSEEKLNVSTWKANEKRRIEEIGNLRAKMKGLTTDTLNLKEQLEQEKELCEEANKRADINEQRCSRLSDELTSMTSLNKNYMGMVRDIKLQAADAAADERRILQRLNEKEKEMRTLTKVKDDLEVELKKKSDTVSTLQVEVHALRSEAAQFATQKRDFQKDAVGNQQELTALKRQLDEDKERSLTKLQKGANALKAAELTTEQLRDKCHTAEANLKECTAERDELKLTIQEKEAALETSELHLVTEDDEKAALSKKLKAYEDLRTKLQCSNEELVKKLETVKKERKELSNSLYFLKEELEALKRANEELRDLENDVSNLKEAAAKNKQLEQKLEHTRTIKSDLERSFEGSREKIKNLKTQLDEHKNRVKFLDAELKERDAKLRENTEITDELTLTLKVEEGKNKAVLPWIQTCGM